MWLTIESWYNVYASSNVNKKKTNKRKEKSIEGGIKAIELWVAFAKKWGWVRDRRNNIGLRISRSQWN